MVRMKKRFLVCQLLAESRDVKISSADIQFCIREWIGGFSGELGQATINPSVFCRFLDSQSKCFVISCLFDDFRLVWFAMTMISSIKSYSLSIRVLKVCGSQRCCKTSFCEIFHDYMQCVKNGDTSSDESEFQILLDGVDL